MFAELDVKQKIYIAGVGPEREQERYGTRSSSLQFIPSAPEDFLMYFVIYYFIQYKSMGNETDMWT